MSYIGKNIKKIRTVKKLSQAAFAELFDLARPSVGAYEEGRSEPKIDTLVQISKHFGLSVDVLLTKELTVNELYGFDIFKKDYTKEISLKKVATTIQEPSGVAFVDGSHTFEYIANHHKQEYIQQLPGLQLSNHTAATTRAFEIADSEMQLQQSGLRPKDILLCSKLDMGNKAILQKDQVYAVVTASKIYIRRFTGQNNDELLYFSADNPDYTPVSLAFSDILEIWKADGVYSTHLNAPVSIEIRLGDLEQTIKSLNNRLEVLEN